LKELGDQPVTVFAIWQPMLPTDWSAPTAGVLARLGDARVRQYWDPNHLVAKRIKDDARPPQPEPGCCERNGILWDLAAVYRADARWADRMPPALFIDGPVVAVTDGIGKVIQPMPRPSVSSTLQPTTHSDLVFLTRGGCVNTTVMRKNLDTALRAMGREPSYLVVDLDTVAADDVRGGYGTPTVLYNDRDLFGMPVPAKANPEVT
jgi:hypothetical protein